MVSGVTWLLVLSVFSAVFTYFVVLPFGTKDHGGQQPAFPEGHPKRRDNSETNVDDEDSEWECWSCGATNGSSYNYCSECTEKKQ